MESLIKRSGSIVTAQFGKHTNEFLAELVANTEGKTDRKLWYTDDWGEYEQALPLKWVHTTDFMLLGFVTNRTG
ncbi:MAG: hypothetical protein AB4040_06775 [Synechococcus sp.]